MTIGDKRSWTHLCLGKFLGAFAKLREATIGLVKPVCLSVRSSAWNNSSPTWWICVEIYICVFMENADKQLKCH